LYFVAFVLLALVQFANNGNLNRQLGALRISGNIRRQNAGQAPRQLADGGVEYLVDDGISLFFGGLEFKLSGGIKNGLAYVNDEGLVQAAYPEVVTISDNEASFQLSGGQQLLFHIDNGANAKKLTISTPVENGIEQILVPFRTALSSSIERDELNGFVVKSENDKYALEAENIYEKRRIVSLSPNVPVLFYRVISDRDTYNIAEFIVSGGRERQVYNEIVNNWRDAAFDRWTRLINSGDRDENTIACYLAETARHGTLTASLGTLPASFHNRTYTFLLAPFLGGLGSSMGSLLTNERERMSLIASFSESAPSNFLTRKDIFEYLYVRGSKDIFDRGIEYVKGLEPSEIDVTMCAGIFEGWLTWNRWMDAETENPFEKFLPRARMLIFANMRKDRTNSHVFLVYDGINILYNIRLGVSIVGFSEATGNSEWAAAGRSLIVSALSFADQELSLSGKLQLSEDGVFTDAGSYEERLTAAQVYNELKFSNFYPHAFGAGKVADSIWVWTISPEIGVSFQNNTLNFDIGFPPGETHYIYVLNIKPFSRIQIRGMAWRSDPQFEQYNAPGWRYIPSEQVLMVKIVQSNNVERISVVF
jgi:hypothetical protein